MSGRIVRGDLDGAVRVWEGGVKEKRGEKGLAATWSKSVALLWEQPDKQARQRKPARSSTNQPENEPGSHTSAPRPTIP